MPIAFTLMWRTADVNTRTCSKPIKESSPAAVCSFAPWKRTRAPLAGADPTNSKCWLNPAKMPSLAATNANMRRTYKRLKLKRAVLRPAISTKAHPSSRKFRPRAKKALRRWRNISSFQPRSSSKHWCIEPIRMNSWLPWCEAIMKSTS